MLFHLLLRGEKKMFIKEAVRKLIYHERRSSKSYIQHLRDKGASIGNGCEIFNPETVTIDGTRPWLITIGNNVQITRGVTILTHGYDWYVLKGVYGEVLGSGGVTIGSNVFVGMYATILKGVHIGNNVIIGANSLVNKNIPDNCVAAGNPCKVIMSLDEYYKKRKSAQLTEAKELAQLYIERYGKEPDEKAFHEFFWLFSDANDELPDCWNSMMKLGENYAYTMERFRENKKQFKNMSDFLNKIRMENNQ